MKRTFKSFTLASAGTPQPLVGTVTTTALLISAVPQSIPVSDSSMFRQGDRMFLGVGSLAEEIFVTAVADSLHVSGVVTKVHASGVTVALSIPITAMYCQTIPGNTAILVIFYPDQQFSSQQVAPNVTGLIKALCQLQPTASPTPPTDVGTANVFGGNPDNLAYYWVDGTNTGDGYLPSVEIT